ncbi:hypothetical protein QBZ16_003277 [Prototheca wickerhamii]|uniref:Uncharacterized protein n=1 Tax=Prototheca wickerhamii TaxID=3111 RepID=A0AAD9MIH7_PROWI|nr:hypothetical protein QBZ16_003277 [Prototheca wickerhamii]
MAIEERMYMLLSFENGSSNPLFSVVQEELVLQELKRQLEARREQLEALKRMREEMQAHERAQFEMVMTRLLDQQPEQSASSSGRIEREAEDLDPSFLVGGEADASRQARGSAASARPPNAIEQEMDAMMQILGSRSFTVLGEDEEGVLDQAARRRSQSADAVPKVPPPR